MTPTNDGPPGDDRPSFAEAMKRVIAERRREAGPHPGLDTLAAYAAGELPEAEAELVRDHLALCAACTGAVLDLSILAGREEADEIDEAADAPPSERTPELETAWSDMRARLEREGVLGEPETVRPAAPVLEMPRRPERVYDAPNVRLPWTVAALLAAACLVLAVKAWQSPSSGEPRPIGVVAEVEPTGHPDFQVRGGDDGAKLSTGSDSVLTLVLPDSAAAQPAFRVEIRPVAGGAPEVIESMPSQAGRELLILLPAGLLDAGRYEALVSPVGGEPAEPLRYPFEVEP